MSDQHILGQTKEWGFPPDQQAGAGGYSILEAARRWRYDPAMVHGWVMAGNVPGVREHDGQKVIAGRVVEAGRPHPSGHFGQKFRDAADDADVYAGAGWHDHEAWRD